MSITANLNNEAVEIISGNDSIVIVDNFQSIRGGRTLDVTGFKPEVIRAGHVILKTTGGDYKPMPVIGTGAVLGLGAITPGSGYTTNGTYTGVALTGGSGSGAKATIVVASNKVSSVTITTKGINYLAGDNLSAAANDIGTSGSGFKAIVSKVDEEAAGYGTLPSGDTYAGILIASIPTNKPFAGIMVRGTVNPAAAPYSMTTILSAVKSALPLIDFRED